MPFDQEALIVRREENVRWRIASAGSFLAVVAFAAIPIGYLLAGPGRGSETVILADILAAAMFSIAIALGAQAFGFLSFLQNRTLARCAAAVMITDALAVAAVGLVLVIDRVPCLTGLYCSGQALGPWGDLGTYLWIPVLGSGYLAAAALLVWEPAVRRTAKFAMAASLLLVLGCALLAWFALPFNYRFSILGISLFYAVPALGLAANGVIGTAFLR